MSVDNPLWGAPCIHGELLKLGFEVAQSSVAKYMVKKCGPPSQGWCTFLRNHASDIAAMDLFAKYWRQYLATDAQSEWAARARRSLKFCEMQEYLSAS